MAKRKLIKICTVITSVITLLDLGFRHLLPLYFLSKLKIESFNLRNNSSIGIIGGADGPTVIFLTSSYDTNYIAIAFGLLSIAGIIYLIFGKKVIK